MPIVKHKMPANIGFRGLKKVIQKTLPQDTPCPYCNVIIEREDPNHSAYISIDHVIPFSQCREHKIENLVATCKFCNELKSDKEVFQTFMIPKPQKLESKEVKAIHTILRYEWQISVLEEIRVLLLIKDFSSIKYYINNLEYKVGSGKLFSFLRKIHQVSLNPTRKDLLIILMNEFNISSRKISPKSLLELIIDMKIDETSKLIQECREITKNISFQTVEINALEKYRELMRA